MWREDVLCRERERERQRQKKMRHETKREDEVLFAAD